jgi:hypothetical protein
MNFDFDKTFLLHGIEFGFDIANQENLPVDILAKNHPSALPGSQLYELEAPRSLYSSPGYNNNISQ